MTPALEKGAEEVAAAQRALAPDDPATGAPDLRTSIAVTPPGQATPAYSQPGGSRMASELEALVTAGNTDVRYAHLQEYGTNLIITQLGEPRSEKSFTNWIIEAAKKPGLPPHRSPRGLRKAACRRLAEAGCTALEIMSITGHTNIKEIETYCAAVNKKRLAEAAIAKLKGAA